MARTRDAVVALLAALALAGCAGTGDGTPSASQLPGASAGSAESPPSTTPAAPLTRRSTRPPAVSPPQAPTPSRSAGQSRGAAAGRVTKLVVVPVENHTFAQMRDQMPWTFALAQRYGYATHFRAITHPSLPNYLAIAGGSTFGVTDDADPAVHPLAGPSVFGLALSRGLTATTYAEGMAVPCQQTQQITAGSSYVPKHNPWAYFVDERGACQSHDLPLTALTGDVDAGALPAAGLVVADLCHIGHDCPLATADAWLRQEVTLLMSGPDWRSGRLAIVITADEDDTSGDNTVLTVVLHPSLHGVVVDTPLSHYSLSRLYAEVLGAPPLREAAAAPSMATAFGLPVGPHG